MKLLTRIVTYLWLLIAVACLCGMRDPLDRVLFALPSGIPWALMLMKNKVVQSIGWWWALLGMALVGIPAGAFGLGVILLDKSSPKSLQVGGPHSFEWLLIAIGTASIMSVCILLVDRFADRPDSERNRILFPLAAVTTLVLTFSSPYGLHSVFYLAAGVVVVGLCAPKNWGWLKKEGVLIGLMMPIEALVIGLPIGALVSRIIK